MAVQPNLLALDASPLERSAIAGTPATVPVIDAGAAKGSDRADPPLPVNVVAATGASPTQGPPVNSNKHLTTPSSAFENFRSAISPYEPIYFDKIGRTPV